MDCEGCERRIRKAISKLDGNFIFLYLLLEGKYQYVLYLNMCQFQAHKRNGGWCQAAGYNYL